MSSAMANCAIFRVLTEKLFQAGEAFSIRGAELSLQEGSVHHEAAVLEHELQ